MPPLRSFRLILYWKRSPPSGSSCIGQDCVSPVRIARATLRKLPQAISSSTAQRAGLWFLNSGIQEPNGGVARFHHTGRSQNAPISTEITGYAVSTFVYFHSVLGEQSYLDRAISAARYLCREAWDTDSATFPFEPTAKGEQAYAYFFDCGIIIRGLLCVWRATGDSEFLDRAKEAGLAMAYDFLADVAVHPILTLPDKQPLNYEPRWSRSPGCYQLKSALAWRDLAQATGEKALERPFERMLEYSLATYDSFLPGDTNQEKVMDRLHAFGYFLEALLAVAERPSATSALAIGIPRLAEYLRKISPVFARSDVYAQLLRVRMMADRRGAIKLDTKAAQEEADVIASFIREDGGFWFGRKGGEFVPFSNPVSTAFCLQAIAMWESADRDLPLGALI